MCVMFFMFNCNRFIAIHNREEYNRSTQSLHHWSGFPQIIASKDLIKDGLFFGYNTQNKRFVGLTNIKNSRIPGSHSRGIIARDLLLADDLDEYVSNISDGGGGGNSSDSGGEKTSGYNIIFGSYQEGFYYFNNQDNEKIQLEADTLYSLGNDRLDCPNLNEICGKRMLMNILKNRLKQALDSQANQADFAQILSIMSSRPIWKNYIFFKTRCTGIIESRPEKCLFFERNYSWFGHNNISLEMDH